MTSAMVSDLANWLSASPTDVAVRLATGTVTVQELAERVSRVASTLRAAKVRAGDRVAISADGLDEVVCLVAVQAVGATTVITPSEEEFRESGATHLIRSERRWEQRGAIDMRNSTARPWNEWTTTSASPDEQVVHACLTSGTTGQSKLVEFSREIASRRADGYIEVWPVRRTASLFRLSSVAGFGALISAIRARQPFVIVTTLDTPTIELLASDDVDALCGAPNQVAQVVLAAKAARVTLSFSTVLTAGAPQTPQFVAAAQSVCSGVISNVYGSTEAGTAAYSTERAATAFRGQPTLDTVFQVVDGDRRPLPTGVEGEIRYTNPGLCHNYVSDGLRVPIADDDGWFYPHDVGRIEEDGTIVITGRLGDVVNVAGVKINPLDVEAAVESIAAVKDAACVPVTLSNGTTHLVLAVVVPDRATHDEVVALLGTRDRVGRPNIVVDVPAIPRNRNGKIVRSELSDTLSKAMHITESTSDD